MIRSLKTRAGEVLLVGADVLGMLLSASGAAVVAFLGKLMLAVVLGALALGFFLRFKGRKGLRTEPPQRPPLWHCAASFTLAAIEAAVLTEATHLPVRLDQPGFAAWRWVLVLAALAVAYSLHMRLFKALSGRRAVASAR